MIPRIAEATTLPWERDVLNSGNRLRPIRLFDHDDFRLSTDSARPSHGLYRMFQILSPIFRTEND
jgi:hypothetical protein